MFVCRGEELLKPVLLVSREAKEGQLGEEEEENLMGLSGGLCRTPV